MESTQVPKTPSLAVQWKRRRGDVLQRRIALKMARNLPGVDGRKRFSLRLYLPLVRPRVYRLKGYTTLKKVDRKLKAGRAQRALWRILFVAVLVLVVAYVLLQLNPFTNLPEIFRMIGIQP
jgi:hypothetical protein